MELVLGASEANMGSLLSKLGKLLSDKYTLIRGVHGDIQYMKDELTTIQSFLHDVMNSGSRSYDSRMKDFLKQIRDVTYDIEDCVDSGHRLHAPRPGMCCQSPVCCYFLSNSLYEVLTWWPSRDFASKLSDLKVRVQLIVERRERYGVFNTQESHYLSGAGFYFCDNEAPGVLKLVTTRQPVGVEDLMTKLQKRVTCIVGFGGLGKTTIATALYRNSGAEYSHRAMVTMSQSTDLEAILRIIRDQVKLRTSNHEQPGSSEKGISQGSSAVTAAICCRSGNSKQARELDLLKEDITKHLNGSRYLVMIDDVWSAPLLDSIVNALPQDLNSRILVTTRFYDVATTQREADIRTVRSLVERESKELFMQAYNESKGIEDVITQPQAPTPTSNYDHESSDEAASETEGTEDRRNHAESSKQAASRTGGSKNGPFPELVWKICGGQPLAIVTMAGYVACNPHRQHERWYDICNTLFPEYGKYGAESLTQEELGRIIRHCYNDMPDQVKICTVFLSIFPKGYKISKKRLTRRWIAEGIVCENQGLSVDDVVETYFNHLVRRKIIRPVEHSGNGTVKKCVVNDMVLEHIVYRASEENFITVVGGNWFMQLPSNNIRRLSIQDSDSKYANDTEKMNLSSVRSLTIFGNLKKQLPSHSFKFGIIHVLDLEGCKGFKQHHIAEICEMLLLKYLSLRKTDTKQLPGDIGKLKNLETLDVRETEVIELPKVVCQLECLVNILGGDKTTRKALRLPVDLKKKMKALQTLSGIEIAGESSELRHMTKLKKLAIYKLETVLSDASLDALRSSIEYLGGCCLQTLIIYDESPDFVKSLDGLSSPPKFLVALELSGKRIKLPKWINQLSVLNKLTLSLTALRTDNLKDLSTLNALFSLTFRFRAKQQDRQTLAIIVENKLYCNGVIMVPDGGFRSLKFLCLSGPLLPLLSFSGNAMPELERLELRYSMLEGILGAEYLVNLEELHLTSTDREKEDRMTKKITKELSELTRIDGKQPRVILHQGPLGMMAGSG